MVIQPEQIKVQKQGISNNSRKIFAIWRQSITEPGPRAWGSTRRGWKRFVNCQARIQQPQNQCAHPRRAVSGESSAPTLSSVVSSVREAGRALCSHPSLGRDGAFPVCGCALPEVPPTSLAQRRVVGCVWHGGARRLASAPSGRSVKLGQKSCSLHFQ